MERKIKKMLQGHAKGVTHANVIALAKGSHLAKAENNVRRCPVGVVMRSEAPLIESLLADREPTHYKVALEERRNAKGWIPMTTPLLISLVGLLDFFKFTK